MMGLPGLLLLSGCSPGPIFGSPTGGPYDIEVTGIEVTQGIQDLDNRMPLVADRETVVRVYARELLGRDVPGVKARIMGTVGAPTSDGGTVGYGFIADSDRITVTPGGSQRLDASTTFDIPLSPGMPSPEPPDTLAAGPAQLSISAIVNDDRLGEEPADNNEIQVVDLELHKPDPLKIHFVPVHLHTPAPSAADDVDRSSPVFEHKFWDNGWNDFVIAATVLRHHPIASDPAGYDISWQGTPVFPVSHAGGSEWNLRVGADRTAINAQIRTLKDLDGEAFKIFYGMVAPSAAAGPFAGWANKGVAWGVMRGTSGSPSWQTSGGKTLAHEVGHRRGLAHMLCSGNEASGGGVDPNYPWPTSNGQPCRLADVDDEGYFGYDVYWFFLGQSGPVVISNSPTTPNPNRGFPLMGYKSPQWVSPYEFCKLMPRYGVPCALTWPAPSIGSIQLAAAAAGVHRVEPGVVDSLTNATRFVYITGWVDESPPRAQLNSFYSYEPPPAPLLSRTIESLRADLAAGARSDWSVVIEDRRGRVLHRHVVTDSAHFVPDGDTTVAEGEEGSLLLNSLLPLPREAARVSVRYRDTEVAARNVSPSTPKVKLREPPRADTLASGYVIRWDASDADGDRLHYALFYSDGANGPWTPIAIELDETRFVITDQVLSGLDASEALHFRIVATDGVNSAAAVSQTGVRVENRPPLVAIRDAERGQDYASGSDLVFFGNAIDREEGLVPVDRLVWRLDGREVGRGARLVLRKMQPGYHELTLEATDSMGLSGSAEITFRVTGTPK